MKYYWQEYERIKTGEKVRFRKTAPNSYLREDGISFSMAKLRRYYEFVRPASKVRNLHKFIVTPNGFKVRLTKRLQNEIRNQSLQSSTNASKSISHANSSESTSDEHKNSSMSGL